MTEAGLAELYSGWQQHSQLLIDSDFSLLEPIMALRTTTQELLIGREQAGERKEHLQTGLTSHLMEMCKLARKAGNTQVCQRLCFLVCADGIWIPQVFT